MDEPAKSPDDDSLENPAAPAVGNSTPMETDDGVVPVPGAPPAQHSANPSQQSRFSIHSLFSRINIYLVIFAAILVVGIVIAVVAYEKNNHAASTNGNIATQNLSAQALQQLASNGTTVGDAEHTLNIQSDSVFQGTVLVRGNLEVAGTVKMGGSLALSGLSISGSSSFGQLQAKSIAVNGNEGVVGQLSAQALSIAGTGNFNGTLTAPSIATNSLQLSGNLQLTHHINTGGAGPSSSTGGALGRGGSSSLSGSDTAGSISLHTGSGPSSGCFVTVFFHSAFGGTPHVIVTPVGSAAAGLGYYINRSSASFSVCTVNAAPASANFGFDYIVIG